MAFFFFKQVQGGEYHDYLLVQSEASDLIGTKAPATFLTTASHHQYKCQPSKKDKYCLSTTVGTVLISWVP